MSVWVADGLQCRPHGLARDVLFSLGHVNSMELLIAELSHKKTTSSISKPAVKGVSSLVFLSKSRSARRGCQVNPAQPCSQHLFLEKREGEGCEVLPFSAHKCMLFRELSCSLSPPRVRGDWHLRQRWIGEAKANANGRSQSERQLGFKGTRERLQHVETTASLIKCHFNVIIFMHLIYLHESACLDVQHVYYELRVHLMAAGLNLRTQKRACQIHVHTPFPIFDPWDFLDNMWLCSWLVLQGLRCTECYRLWITPHWVLAHLFRRTRHVF